MNHMNTTGHCRCPHHKSGALIIILFGLTFLLGTMGIVSGMFVSYTWPLLLIVFGVTRLIGGSCRCYTKA